MNDPTHAATTLPQPTGQASDFDFLHGRWSVGNRRLMTRLAGAADWTDFPATSACEPRLGGSANVDQLDFTTQGWSGLTLRSFDPARRQWAIYWISSRNGLLQAPVYGGFEGEVGEFYGVDEDAGRPIEVRFIWTRLGPARARWEQAFRPQGVAGAAWESNWVMEFSRRP